MMATALLIAPVGKNDTWNHPMPRTWYVKLAQCETANDPTHGFPMNRHSNYVTRFGIAKSTWAYWNHTPTSKAYKLTFAQQARGVDRIAFYGHTENGTYRHPVGLYGWGAIKGNCNGLNDDLCKSRHPDVIKIRRCK